MFYDRFINLCDKKGVTPVQVRKDLGISQSTMASWKSRGLTPNATTLAKLADYFGVIMADLLDGNEAKIYNTGFVDGAVAQDMHNQEVERNVVKIAGRDGRFIEKHLSNEQLEALMTLIEQLPEAPDNI